MTDLYDTLGEREWKTRDGTKMKWRDMTPRHLRNCAAMIERANAAETSAAWRLYSTIQGEYAEYAMEAVIDGLDDRNATDREYIADLRSFAGMKEARDA